MWNFQQVAIFQDILHVRDNRTTSCDIIQFPVKFSKKIPNFDFTLCSFGICYMLNTLKVQLIVELVKCTLLLNRLLVLQIYCVLLVLVIW